MGAVIHMYYNDKNIICIYIYNAKNYGMLRMLEIKRMSSKFQVSNYEYGSLHFAFEMIQQYKTNMYLR